MVAEPRPPPEPEARPGDRWGGKGRTYIGVVLAGDAPDLVELDLLVSVAETGSLGQAAARHHLSQPAVSMRMTGLERRLGLRLLRRDPSGTRPTAAGAEIVAAARRVITATEELVALAGHHRAERSALLRVASSLTVAEQLLPRWLGVLQADMPGLSLTLEVVNTARVLAIVADHRVDVGFVEGTDRPLRGLVSRVVSSDELVVVVGPTHRWARRRRPVSGPELAGCELIVREQGSGTREILDAALAPFGGTRARQALGSSAAVMAATRRGDAPGVISALVASEEIQAGRLVAVPTVGLDLRRNLRAVWPGDGVLSELAAQLLNVISGDEPTAR